MYKYDVNEQNTHTEIRQQRVLVEMKNFKGSGVKKVDMKMILDLLYCYISTKWHQ